MAIVETTREVLGRGAYLHTWDGLANGDTGRAVSLAGAADRSVQITGTFGAGGTVVIEGTNDGTNYVTLTDPQGNALSFTAAGLEAVSELVRYIRPQVTAGDGDTDINVSMILKE